MSYKKILMAYIMHVALCEGTYFIGHDRKKPDKGVFSALTQEEFEALCDAKDASKEWETELESQGKLEGY